jgi:hypothetical protein
MSALLEIGELVRTRPPADASTDVLAAWYEQKSVVLRHIATETTAPSERDTYLVWAERAHVHAEELECCAGDANLEEVHPHV